MAAVVFGVLAGVLFGALAVAVRSGLRRGGDPRSARFVVAVSPRRLDPRRRAVGPARESVDAGDALAVPTHRACSRPGLSQILFIHRPCARPAPRAGDPDRDGAAHLGGDRDHPPRRAAAAAAASSGPCFVVGGGGVSRASASDPRTFASSECVWRSSARCSSACGTTSSAGRRSDAPARRSWERAIALRRRRSIADLPARHACRRSRREGPHRRWGRSHPPE